MEVAVSPGPDFMAQENEAAPSYPFFLALCEDGPQNVSPAWRMHKRLQKFKGSSRSEDTQLVCTLSTGLMGKDYANILAPFKVEQFSVDPQITVIHDFVSESEHMEVLEAVSEATVRRKIILSTIQAKFNVEMCVSDATGRSNQRQRPEKQTVTLSHWQRQFPAAG